MNIKDTVNFFRSLGFNGGLNEKETSFIMEYYSDLSHIDVKGNIDGYVLVRLIDNRKIVDYLEINKFDEEYFDITKQTIKFWNNF